MISNIINSKNIIHKTLDAVALRNEVISQNIANADTPNYNKKKVVFEELLRSQMAQDNNNLPNIQVIEHNPNFKTRMDGNSVDIDVEMTELSKNAIRYQVLTKLSGYSRVNTVLTQLK